MTQGGTKGASSRGQERPREAGRDGATNEGRDGEPAARPKSARWASAAGGVERERRRAEARGEHVRGGSRRAPKPG